MSEVGAITEYQQQHVTCDIQKHPWQHVFSAGYAAGAALARQQPDGRDQEIQRLRAALEDFERFGLRFDLLPTNGHARDWQWWQDRLQDADKHVRGRARAALAPAAPPALARTHAFEAACPVPSHIACHCVMLIDGQKCMARREAPIHAEAAPPSAGEGVGDVE